MRLERRNHGRGHSYRLDGQKVLGVTTVLNSLPKPALVNWAARQAAEKAVNEWDQLALLTPTERLNALSYAHRDTMTRAALRGTQIHDLGEKLSHGEGVDVPAEHLGPVEAYARFLDRWDITPIATETPLASLRYSYGGTADCWATIGNRDGIRALIDIKTGKGVYEEVALQLAAYRYADIWQPDSDTEEELPEVDEVYVAHVLADDVRLLPVTVDLRTFRQFLYVMQTDRWISQVRDESPVGYPLTPPEAA